MRNLEKELELKRIQEKIDELSKERSELFKVLSDIEPQYKDSVIDRLNKLANDIFNLEDKIMFVKGPIYNNEYVDIYLDEKNSIHDEHNYLISRHGCMEIIGHVRLTFDDVTSYLGNIGYSLDKKYRGNGYMIESLRLLKTPLINRNVTKPVLTVFPDNISSIKTIKRLGGTLIEPANSEHRCDIYQVDLTSEFEPKKR